MLHVLTIEQSAGHPESKDRVAHGLATMIRSAAISANVAQQSLSSG